MRLMGVGSASRFGQASRRAPDWRRSPRRDPRPPERHADRSTSSTAAGIEATLGRKGLSHEGAADDSDGHRRRSVVEPPITPTPSQERPMKNLIQALASLFILQRTPSIEEQYLAQAIDANDFEVRLQALERARP
jgi:hypothetical protein